MEKHKRGLGRGLSALMADVGVPGPDAPQVVVGSAETILPIEQIVPNPDQPRRRFSDEALQELAASIREKGVIQPLIVRRAPDGASGYQIVAGERRWRAAQLAQLHELPVIVRDLGDTEVLEIAIIENIQRADLNAIEEAAGYRQLMDRFGHTQDQLAVALGKSRSHIANLLRLLSLPDSVQGMVQEGVLSAGHARALVPLPQPEQAARQVIAQGLSVRGTEKLAKTLASAKTELRKTPSRPEKDADTVALERELAAALGLKITIDHDAASGRGTLSLGYRSLEDLDDLCGRLTAMQGAGTI